jgi:putative heme-binding domain-containing protein
VNATQARILRAHPDAKLRALAIAVLPDRLKQRAAVVESFSPALSLKGDAARGHAIYQKLCISCHRAGSEGHAVGPDLVTVKNSGGEKLLLSILDPNREVAASYVAYLVETKDAQSVLGVVASDTPTHITIREAYGKETTLSRDQIKRMTSQGLSIMPEGLEQGLSPQDMADLIRFIEGASR